MALLLGRARSSQGLARWGVLFTEAGELIWLVPTKVFADLLYRWLHCDFQNVLRKLSLVTSLSSC
jgi:hypothetical protein